MQTDGRRIQHHARLTIGIRHRYLLDHGLASNEGFDDLGTPFAMHAFDSKHHLFHAGFPPPCRSRHGFSLDPPERLNDRTRGDLTATRTGGDEHLERPAHALKPRELAFDLAELVIRSHLYPPTVDSTHPAG